MKTRPSFEREVLTHRKGFRIILVQSVSLFILTLFDWGKMLIITLLSTRDTNIRFNVYQLLGKLNDIVRALRLFSIETQTLPLIRALIIIGLVVLAGSFLALLASLAVRQQKARAQWACLGFFLHALACAACMVGAPIADSEVEIASMGIVQSIIHLTAFPYISFGVAFLSLLNACWLGRNNKKAHTL